MSEPKDPTVFNIPDQGILKDADIDNVAHALIALAHEVWIIKDRTIVLESVLAKHGIDAEAEVDAFEPDAHARERLDDAGQKLMSSILTSLAGR